MCKRDTFLTTIGITAIEGGINYWSSVTEYRYSTRSTNGQREGSGQPTSRGGDSIFAIVHEDDGGTFEVTNDVIEAGIARILDGPCEGASRTTRAILTRTSRVSDDEHAEIDAIVADEVVQAGLFGSVVYG